MKRSQPDVSEFYLWVTPHDYHPGTFLHTIDGTIHVGSRDTMAGWFRCYYADFVGAGRAGVSPLQVLDPIPVYKTLISRGHPMLSTFPDGCNWYSRVSFSRAEGNLLVLDELALYPRYRGQGLGLRVQQARIARFGCGASVLAMCPLPLQYWTHPPGERKWYGKLRLRKAQQAADTQKLYRHYEQLGFVRLVETPLMTRRYG